MIDIRVDVEDAIKYIEAHQRQIPFALSRTLNDLAFNVARKKMPEEANNTFEGGATAYTRRAFKYRKSNKRYLISEVYVSMTTHEYMRYQLEGGTRLPQRKRILVPTDNIRKNKFGNLTRGARSKLFTDKDKYFQGKPKGKTGERFEGVWQRYGRGKKKIRMVAKYAKSADYSKKLDMVGITRDYVTKGPRSFKPTFVKYFDLAVGNIR